MHRSRARTFLLLLIFFVIYLVHSRLKEESIHGFVVVLDHSDYSDEHPLEFPVDEDTGLSGPLQVHPPPPQLPILCQAHECGTGKWVARQEPYQSFDQVKAAYPNHIGDPLWDGCRVTTDLSGNPVEGEQKTRLEQERLVNALNWEWLPDRGKLEYDPVDFVARMLQRSGGLIIVGDSISGQHMHTINFNLIRHGIHFDSNPSHLRLAGAPNVEQLVLNKNHPITKVIQKRAGVPDSRLDRPFISFLEDHMALNETDIRAITNAKPDYFWYHNFRRVESGWLDQVKWLAAPREGEEDSVKEDTLIMFNAGAHWSRHELSMLRAPTVAEEQALLEEVYPRMMDLIIDRLSTIERTSVYYRSTSPPHPQCSKSSVPYKNIEDAQLKEQNVVQRLLEGHNAFETEIRGRWDWDLFQPHNKMWDRRIRSMSESRPKDSKSAKWFYFDIWDMSIQRPDAHHSPAEDCLHWCLPVVFDDWTRLFYHRVNLDEGRGR